MEPRRATQLLRLPVQLHGIRLGHPVDVLLDAAAWRALGFVVLCGDDRERFLVFAAAEPREDELVVPSAFLLLEGVDFYRRRSRSLRSLLGRTVVSEGLELGELQDIVLARDGVVESLIVENDGALGEAEPAATTVEPERVPAV